MLTYTTKFRLLNWTKKVWNLVVHAQPKWHHSTCFVFLLSSLHFRTLFVVKISDGKQGFAEIFLWNWSRHYDVFNQISFFKITDFLFTWRFFNMGFSMIESYVVDLSWEEGRHHQDFSTFKDFVCIHPKIHANQQCGI